MMRGGSSPRGRGKQEHLLSLQVSWGLIPAWAGKTRRRPAPCGRNRAHPRVGGENVHARIRSALNPGSSPRGRGKRTHSLSAGYAHGLIPAWAGKTTRAACRPRGTRAHPRVGGENLGIHAYDAQGQGSSPRGRGKLPNRGIIRNRERLIPAWAGKTPRWCRRRRGARAHPRVGGENDASQVTQTTGPGSSPRGRGKHCRPHQARPDRRLIPAWAGKTRPYISRRAKCRAHPRVGGENLVCPGRRPAHAGSSPRGRGKRFEASVFQDFPRLIPAWAGKT